jgi:hypothetical protein
MSSSVITINAVPLPPAVPTAASTIQPTCGTPSGTIVFSTQTGVEYSLNGTTSVLEYVLRLAPNDYTLYVRNSADATCNYVILANNNKYCATSSCGSNGISYGSAYLCYTIRNNTITTQSELNIVNGTVYQSSNSFAGLARELYFICQKPADPSCVTMSGSTTTINSIPPPPVVPTTASVTQPTCAVQSGSISVTTQSGVEYSLDGTTYQASNTFSGLTRMIILYMFRAPVIILV